MTTDPTDGTDPQNGQHQTDPSSEKIEEKTPEEQSREDFDKYSIKEGSSEKAEASEKQEKEEIVPDTQQSEKDKRHFDRVLQKNVQGKIELAKKLLEKDRDEIYAIADQDPTLAEHLLREYDYGTTSVDELLSKGRSEESYNDQAIELQKSQAKTSKEVEFLRNKLMDSEVRRLRENDPTLEGEVEEKFRELVQRPDFENEDAFKVLQVAKALVGKKVSSESTMNDVANELLNAVQGSMTTSAGGSQEQEEVHSKAFKQAMQAMDVSKQDLKEYEAEHGSLE